MDDFTQVLNDPIQRRLAIRIVLALGMIAGLAIGVTIKWYFALAFVVLILLYFGYLTIRDLKAQHADPPKNSSEDSL